MSDDKSLEEIVVHPAAGLAPIKVFPTRNFFAPKLVIVRIGCEGRKDMTAFAASQNVDPELVKNGMMLQLTT
jgi:hypothetical protein